MHAPKWKFDRLPAKPWTFWDWREGTVTATLGCKITSQPPGREEYTERASSTRGVRSPGRGKLHRGVQSRSRVLGRGGTPCSCLFSCLCTRKTHFCTGCKKKLTDGKWFSIFLSLHCKNMIFKSLFISKNSRYIRSTLPVFKIILLLLLVHNLTSKKSYCCKEAEKDMKPLAVR